MSDWVLKYKYDFHGAKYVNHFYKASITSQAPLGLLGIVSSENFISPYKTKFLCWQRTCRVATQLNTVSKRIGPSKVYITTSYRKKEKIQCAINLYVGAKTVTPAHQS